MSTPGPREGGPRRRRTFTPTEKLGHLLAYEAACTTGEGGAYLREHGIYSAQISEWRKLRDAGMPQDKKPGAKIGRPSAEQADTARLTRELELTRSHSRPKVSNDSPYSDPWNTTLKYAPAFPERFTSLHAARVFVAEFVDYYNHDHRHAGIGLRTPGDFHYGLAIETARQRSAVLAPTTEANVA